jgi:folylpolyglutamate synthase/dihydropteroate synthase
MYEDALKVDVIGITGTNGKTSVACFSRNSVLVNAM